MTFVTCETRDAIAVLTLSAPEDYHALDLERMEQLVAAIDAAQADPAIRVICLTASGKGFCSGARFGYMFELGSRLQAELDRVLQPILTRLYEGSKPVVVAVNGPAAGAGVGLAMAGDITIAARSASFRLSFARLGAVLDGGTSWHLPRRIGTARARAIALTGQPIDAETAAEWGMIWRCVDDEHLHEEMLNVASQIAASAPLALAWIRQQLGRAPDMPLTEAIAEEHRIQALAFETTDLQEGVSAFRARRAPRFTGS